MKVYKVFTLLASKKVSLHSFMSTGRRSKTPELETKESLLLTAIAVARISELVSCPKSQIPQGQTKRYKSHLHVWYRRGTLSLESEFFIMGNMQTDFPDRNSIYILYWATNLSFAQRKKPSFKFVYYANILEKIGHDKDSRLLFPSEENKRPMKNYLPIQMCYHWTGSWGEISTIDCCESEQAISGHHSWILKCYFFIVRWVRPIVKQL